MTVTLGGQQKSVNGQPYKQDVGGSSPSLPTKPLKSAHYLNAPSVERPASSAGVLTPASAIQVRGVPFELIVSLHKTADLLGLSFRDAVLAAVRLYVEQPHQFKNKSQRIKAGMQKARAKGAVIGAPRVPVDPVEVTRLRMSGTPWRELATELGISKGTALRAFQSTLTTQEKASWQQIEQAKELLRQVKDWLRTHK